MCVCVCVCVCVFSLSLFLSFSGVCLKLTPRGANSAIDLPLLNEDQEQAIIDPCVELAAQALESCIPSEAIPLLQCCGQADEQEAFRAHLVELLRDRITLPSGARAMLVAAAGFTGLRNADELEVLRLLSLSLSLSLFALS